MNFKYVFMPYICMYIVYIRDDFRSFVMPTIIFRERKKLRRPLKVKEKKNIAIKERFL